MFHFSIPRGPIINAMKSTNTGVGVNGVNLTYSTTTSLLCENASDPDISSSLFPVCFFYAN